MPKKFYQLSRLERLAALQTEKTLTTGDAAFFRAGKSLTQQRAGQLIENQLTTFSLPEGMARQLLVNGKYYQGPMVTEEPSVIAAASNGAKLAVAGGGFTTNQPQRLLIGQIIIIDIADMKKMQLQLKKSKTALLKIANAAHPSLQQRGGGAKWLRLRPLSQQELSLDLVVDVQQAMGANMVNTMLEAVAAELRPHLQATILMSILSNHGPDNLVTAKVALPLEALSTAKINGTLVASKIAAASRIAQLDPYRAVTHNKGIMNGITAAALAFGNDFRAIESAAHAFAVRNGQYRGLSQWQVRAKTLQGELTLPLPVGFVGGATKALPAVKPNQRLAHIDSAEELMQVLCALGLAQNLAALKALVTTGIQQGHMALQVKSLAISAGASTDEVLPLSNALKHAEALDLTTAKQLLHALRQRR